MDCRQVVFSSERFYISVKPQHLLQGRICFTMFRSLSSIEIFEWLIIAYGSICAVMELGKFVSKSFKPGEPDSQGNTTAEVDLRALEIRKPGEMWNTAIFFPDFLLNNPESPVSKIITLINEAKISIRICMFCCSYSPFLKAIQRKYKEGLIVQIVSNKRGRNRDIPTRVYRPSELGINGDPVRILMHNKFIIFDDEAVMTGSLNWTKDGVTCNQENVIVSTKPEHVKPYLNRFIQLWYMTAPTPSPPAASA